RTKNANSDSRQTNFIHIGVHTLTNEREFAFLSNSSLVSVEKSGKCIPAKKEYTRMHYSVSLAYIF
ncbi:MAG: hypothetical protein J5662_07790, partial [Clostridia bacterium]|nr:hypothetical protein [Clostridia bacterium]